VTTPGGHAGDSPAHAAARRLWERAVASLAEGADAYAATDRVLADLEHGLHRWIGAEGYAALLQRAVALTLPAHPALVRIEDLGLRSPPRQAATVTDDEIRAGVVALLVALMELLGRIIGVEMAMRLVEQLGRPSPRGIVSTESEVARDE
jgi:hypothetical protein